MCEVRVPVYLAGFVVVPGGAFIGWIGVWRLWLWFWLWRRLFLRRGWLRCIFVTLPQWLVVIHLRLVLLCVLYLRRCFLIGRHFFAFGFGFGVDFVLRLFLRFSCMCLLMLFAVSIAAAKCVANLAQLLFLGGGWVFVWTLSFCHFSQALRSCLFDKLFSPPRLFGCHGEQLLLFCNRSV